MLRNLTIEEYREKLQALTDSWTDALKRWEDERSALLLAARFTRVLDIILSTYSFMVSGLLVPIIGALFWRRSSPAGAIAATTRSADFRIKLSGLRCWSGYCLRRMGT